MAWSPRDDQDPLMARLEVKVMFGQYPPNINILKPGKRVRLSEANVGILDTTVITEADVIIRPYNWEVNGKTGRRSVSCKSVRPRSS